MAYTWYKLFYNYDSQGRLVNVNFVDEKYNDSKYNIIYSHDDKSRLKKVDWLNNDNSIRYRWIIEYSTDKNFKISEYGPLDGKLEFEYYYVNGLLTTTINYLNPEKCTYSYDSQRKLIKKDSSKYQPRIYKYNQKGWDANYDYATDSKGNWTLKREKEDPGEIYILEEREITYK
jgi:hypothetical protein